MDFGLSIVPCLVGSYDGTLELCDAPDVYTTITLYRSLFWINRTHSIFQSRSKSSLPWVHDMSFQTDDDAAREYDLDSDIVHNTISMSDLVSCELFPNGQLRFAPGNKFWCAESGSLDDWLS
jgi:hypothetical protein